MITETKPHDTEVDLNEEITLKMTLKDLLILAAASGSCSFNRLHTGISYRGDNTKFTDVAEYLATKEKTETALIHTTNTLDRILLNHGFNIDECLRR